MCTRLTRVVLASLALALSAPLAAAQSTTGSISGLVTDLTGGVVPGATIVATQSDTGIQRTQTTDVSGYYRLLNLNPGQYDVRVTLLGFRARTHDGVVVNIGRDARVDLELTVDAIVDVVNVEAETQRLDVGATALGGLVTTRQISELPLNGRSFMQLASFQLGVKILF